MSLAGGTLLGIKMGLGVLSGVWIEIALQPVQVMEPQIAVVDRTTQILAFLSPIILLALGFLFKKLETVHKLVNSRLSAALEKIDRLERRLQEVTGLIPTGEPPALAAKPTDLIPRKEPVIP